MTYTQITHCITSIKNYKINNNQNPKISQYKYVYYVVIINLHTNINNNGNN